MHIFYCVCYGSGAGTCQKPQVARFSQLKNRWLRCFWEGTEKPFPRPHMRKKLNWFKVLTFKMKKIILFKKIYRHFYDNMRKESRSFKNGNRLLIFSIRSACKTCVTTCVSSLHAYNTWSPIGGMTQLSPL